MSKFLTNVTCCSRVLFRSVDLWISIYQTNYKSKQSSSYSQPSNQISISQISYIDTVIVHLIYLACPKRLLTMHYKSSIHMDWVWVDKDPGIQNTDSKKISGDYLLTLPNPCSLSNPLLAKSRGFRGTSLVKMACQS